jgi:hypothetical protein
MSKYVQHLTASQLTPPRQVSQDLEDGDRPRHSLESLVQMAGAGWGDPTSTPHIDTPSAPLLVLRIVRCAKERRRQARLCQECVRIGWRMRQLVEWASKHGLVGKSAQ